MMFRHNRLLTLLGLIIVALAITAYSLKHFIHNDGRATMSDGAISNLELTSPAFKEGEAIPQQYTCRGDNVSLPLNITGVPEQAKSLALIMHDPDAVNGDFLHWLMWDIAPATTSIGANSVPVGAIQGPNGSGDAGYTGPCPPAGTGTHHYIFELYALDSTLSLDAKSDRDKLQDSMKDHILGQTTLTGLFGAKQ